MMAMALLAPGYRTLFLTLAIWLGLTRVLVGAHYTSDVIAGLAFGGWVSIMSAILFARHRILFREVNHGLPVLRRSIPIEVPVRMLEQSHGKNKGFSLVRMLHSSKVQA
jgi:undecaprenyl-diphosphatase